MPLKHNNNINILTVWNTSDPSSKSTTAKNSLLEYDWEYLKEFATIVNSSCACLQTPHCLWGAIAVNIMTTE